MAEETHDSPQKTQNNRPWVGVAVDVFSTVVLLVLGFDPAYEVVTRHRHESALVLGMLHIIMVPSAILTAMVRSEKLDLLRDKPGFIRQTIDIMFLLFFVFGWLSPILVFAQRTEVPGWMIHACIYAHVAPLVVTVVLGIFKRAAWMDHAAIWISRRWEPQAVLYGAYLAGIEVFLMLAHEHKSRFGPLPLVIWAGAYVPTRLLLAQISGLQGPERWTFVATNVHLLVRLLIAHFS